jgi:hypothetical protein
MDSEAEQLADEVIEYKGNVRLWHKVDIRRVPFDVRYWGVKRTSAGRGPISAFDPNRSREIKSVLN